jgi:KaiC/GvpD/RAD55 family RecA-like ATPase
VKHGRFYPLIIGEHGTGKTSLITLAVNGMNEPKGVVYVDIPLQCDLEVNVTKAMREALGGSPDKLIDSNECNCCSSLLVLLKANRFVAASLKETLKIFSHFAEKYKQEYKRAPVLIIDNANRLAQKHQRLLDIFQYYAKKATDDDIATVMFVSNEDCVLRRMMRNRSCWLRSGKIIEIGDISKEEALQYLKLRKIDEEQAAQIYELVGGRMGHLKYMADKIERRGALEGMCMLRKNRLISHHLYSHTPRDVLQRQRTT